MSAELVAQLDALDRLVLCSPRRWTKGTSARYGNGQEASYNSPRAARWCLMGAAFRVAGEKSPVLEVLTRAVAVEAGLTAPGAASIAAFNDDPKTTFADIKRVIAKARELAVAA